MPMLDEKTQQEVRNILSNMVKPVTVKLWSQEFECIYCKATHDLMNELVTLNDKLKLEVHDLLKDAAIARQFGIEKIPAMAIMGEKDYSLRFYGLPAGYEFSSLLSALLMVSTGVVQLQPETKAWLDKLDKPLHLQVFVTPTCPYCPPAVMLAHKLAFYSDKVTADMVEISEFPHLAVKYGVQGVPRTVINETVLVEGAIPEEMLLDKLKGI